MNWQLISVEKCPWVDEDILITLESVPGPIRRFFGAKPKLRQFVGSSTVWHEYPSFKRASTDWECYLSDRWAQYKYGML